MAWHSCRSSLIRRSASYCAARSHGLLLRRHPERANEVAFSLVDAPATTPLEELARVAGARWTIDDLFTLAKGQVGLDHDEVRSW